MWQGELKLRTEAFFRHFRAPFFLSIPRENANQHGDLRRVLRGGGGSR